jgi:hypothetical protein
MISGECRSRIRRLFFAEHWKVGTIAAELGVRRDTVHLAIESKRFTNVVCRASWNRQESIRGLGWGDDRSAGKRTRLRARR